MALSTVVSGKKSGTGLTSGGDGVIIGENAGDTITTGTGFTLLGQNSDGAAAASSDMIALGYGMIAGSNQLVIGSTNGNGITDAYIGKGITNSSPFPHVSINPSGGSGSNIAASNLVINAGISTGNATPGSVIFNTSDAGSSGSSAQSLSEKMRINGATGFVGIGTASPLARFSVVGSGATNATYSTSISNSSTEYLRLYDDKRFAIQGKVFIDKLNTPGTWTDLNNTQAQGLSLQTSYTGTDGFQAGFFNFNVLAGTSSSSHFTAFRADTSDQSTTNPVESNAVFHEMTVDPPSGAARTTPIRTILARAGVFGSTGITVSNFYIIASHMHAIDATNSITNLYGFYFNPTISSGSITNSYGLYVESASGPITNKWGIYVADSGATNFFAGNVQLADAANIVLGTSTGSKIGTAPTQKLGFLGATPVVQQTGGVATAGPVYGAIEQGMLQTAYNCLRTFGLLS